MIKSPLPSCLVRSFLLLYGTGSTKDFRKCSTTSRTNNLLVRRDECLRSCEDHFLALCVQPVARVRAVNGIEKSLSIEARLECISLAATPMEISFALFCVHAPPLPAIFITASRVLALCTPPPPLIEADNRCKYLWEFLPR